jgi:DNA polymerase-3 subunit delta
MVITLFGDNAYLIRFEVGKQIADFSLSNDDLGIEKIDAGSMSLEDLKQSLSSYSFLSPNRLIILSEPSKIKNFSEEVEQICESIADTTQLVIVEPTLDKRQTYYKFLSSKTDFRILTRLSEQNLIDWVINYTKDKGGKINRSEAVHLIDRVGDDQLLLSSEIEKLLLYQNELNIESIDLLTEASPSSTIFQLLDSAFSANSSQALTLYNDQRQQKVEPEQILSMITWQVHTLSLYMTAKNMSVEQVASATKLSPFTVRKASQIASKLSYSNLKTMVSELAQMDTRSKTVGLSLDEGLKNFIVGLSI